jgi:integrase
MLTVKLRYILQDTDRHGNPRIYFRKRGSPMTRMRHEPGSREFMDDYHALVRGETLESETPAPRITKPTAGTWRALCVSYFASGDFKQLDARVQRVRRQILETTFTEPLSQDSKDLYGDMPVVHMGMKAVRVLRDRKSTVPEAANMRLKSIRQVFKWALSDEVPGVVTNPARDVEYFHSASDGFHTWSIEEVERFERFYPIGTPARLAFAILMYLGVRRSDLVRLGPQHVRGGWITFTVFKGRNRDRVELSLPILKPLQAVLEGTPCGNLTFLVTTHGKPFTSNGFGNRMRKWCDTAGLPDCTAHGLRKAGATIAAENGATDHQLMAIFGWKTIKQAERYTKKARQKKLAGSAMGLMERTEESDSPDDGVQKRATK